MPALSKPKTEIVQPPDGIPEIGGRDWQPEAVQSMKVLPYVPPDQLMLAQQTTEDVQEDGTKTEAEDTNGDCDHVRASYYSQCGMSSIDALTSLALNCTLGVLFGVLAFPVGLLCCLADRQVQCEKCGQVFEEGCCDLGERMPLGEAIQCGFKIFSNIG